MQTFAHCIDHYRLLAALDADQVQAQTLQWFAPQFTYHAFGTDEIISGYEDLRISLVFSGFSFEALLNVEYKDKDDTWVQP